MEGFGGRGRRFFCHLRWRGLATRKNDWGVGGVGLVGRQETSGWRLTLKPPWLAGRNWLLVGLRE